MFTKIFFVVFSVLLLIYMLIPGPLNVYEFPALPNSIKSTLSGDTWQVYNIKAYYSDNYRPDVANFYINAYKDLNLLWLTPWRLNYPPEYAFFAIKDQTHSTYLEELVYPLRNSLFINGLEPYDQFTKQQRFPSAYKFVEGGKSFETKVTLRYYPSKLWVRLVTWLGITISIYFLWKMTKKIMFEK